MNNKIMAMVVVAIIVVAGVGAYYVLSDNGNDDGGIDLVSSGNYLKIFGNANGDDILDSKDVEIIQSYVDGNIDSSDLIEVLSLIHI